MQANFSDSAVPEIDPVMWSTAMTVVNTTEWKKGKAESYRSVTCSRKYRKAVHPKRSHLANSLLVLAAARREFLGTT